MTTEQTLDFTGVINPLNDKTKLFMKRIFPKEDLCHFRVNFDGFDKCLSSMNIVLQIRTIKSEIVVTFDENYDIIVIQNACKH